MAKAGDYVGTLRVHVLDAEGLSSRDDGSARQAYATVNVTDFSKRRTARRGRGAGGARPERTVTGHRGTESRELP